MLPLSPKPGQDHPKAQQQRKLTSTSPKSKPRSQIFAIKKETHFKFLAAFINYGGAFNKHGKSIPGPPQRCLKNSDSIFFRLPVFTELQDLSRMSNSQKKKLRISPKEGTANMKHPTWQEEAMYASRSSRMANNACPLFASAWLLEATLLDYAWQLKLRPPSTRREEQTPKSKNAGRVVPVPF